MVLRVLAVVLAALCAFFLYYTARLLLVTGMLQNVRVGGQGAYIGIVVFPLLALIFGFASFRCWMRLASQGDTDTSPPA